MPCRGFCALVVVVAVAAVTTVLAIPPDAFDFSTAVVEYSPTQLGSWKPSCALTLLALGEDNVYVEFALKDGPGRWPDVTPPGWGGPLEYSLGIVYNISGTMYASAPIMLWNGLNASGGPIWQQNPPQLSKNWFYDPGRWGAMASHQPAVGETLYFFVCEGACRGYTDGSESPLQTRTNVVAFEMPAGPATFRFPSE